MVEIAVKYDRVVLRIVEFAKNSFGVRDSLPRDWLERAVVGRTIGLRFLMASLSNFRSFEAHRG
jgi:hypothetical protein